MSGGGLPGLNSDQNDARRGMDNLPWILELGPQLVTKIEGAWEFKLGIFEALGTDFKMSRTKGQVIEGKGTFKWDSDFHQSGFMRPGPANGQISLSIRGGSEDFLSTYFDVPESQATPDRPSYGAKSGLLGGEISFFQTIHSGRASLYAGMSASDYQFSANRESPLHKSDGNMTYLVGLTYVLGESQKRSVPIEETEGFINKYRHRHDQPF